MANGPYTTWTDAPVIVTERPHTQVVYGEPYTNTITWQNLKLKTSSLIQRYKILFLSPEAADACVAAKEAEYAIEGATYSPARTVATVKASKAYDTDAYDVEVDYCNSTVTEISATGA